MKLQPLGNHFLRDPTDLFAYGDVDGKGVDAKLQHPLDVQMGPADEEGNPTLFVADAYNHKIKKVTQLHTKNAAICQTLQLAGDTALFSEPGGLAFNLETGTLIVADTNNSELKRVDLATGSLALIDLRTGDQVDGGPVDSQRRFDQAIRSSIPLPDGIQEATLQLQVLPKRAGMKINAEAPNKITANDGVQVVANSSLEAWNEVAVRDFGDAFSLSLRLFLCDEAGGTCAVQNIRLEVQIERQVDAEKGENMVTIKVPVE